MRTVGLRPLGLVLTASALVLALVQPAQAFWPFAKATKQAEQKTTESVLPDVEQPVIRLSTDALEERAIRQSVAKLLLASNNHDLKSLLSFYSPQFTSGDRMDLKTIREMITETWEMYPDIRYRTKVLQIRLNGDWATVETDDHSTATAPNKQN